MAGVFFPVGDYGREGVCAVEQFLALNSSTIVGLAWPTLALIAGCVFFAPIYRTLTALAKNVEKGASVTAFNLVFGPPPPDEAKVTKDLTRAAKPSQRNSTENLATITEFADDPLSDANLALFHTSFRRPDKDAEFFGQTMFQIEVIVLGPESALDQIESVTYHMAPSYPRREYVRGVDKRRIRFKLKELANGYSIIRAEVRFKDGHAPLHLNRFIDIGG